MAEHAAAACHSGTPSEWLMAIANYGDRQALGHLFAFYAPRLKSWLLRQNLDDAAAEDIIQDTMLMVWRKAGQYDPARGGASTWIYAIARNLRAERYRRAGQISLGGLDLADCAAPVPQQDDALSVRETLKNLPRDQLDIVHDMFFLGMTQQEIAQARRLPLGTVKSRLRLAMEKLRALTSKR